MVNLWLVVQQEGESFRSYIKRYTSVYIDAKNLNNFAVQTFITGLTNEHVRYALIHKDVSTMHKLVARAQKFAEANEIRDYHYTRARQSELRK